MLGPDDVLPRARPLGRRVRRALRRPGGAADDAARRVRAPRGDRRADRRGRRRGVRRLPQLRQARARGALHRACSARRARRCPALVRRLPPRLARDRLLQGRRRAARAPLRDDSEHLRRRCCAREYFTDRFNDARARRGSPTAPRRSTRQCDSPSYLDHLLDIDARLWLPDDLLAKVDRATMAYSLEARVPYLDHGFYGWCARLDRRSSRSTAARARWC